MLGNPTFDEPSADGKTTTEYIVGYGEEIYTIYDYKQYDNPPKDNPYTPIRWHIGGYENAYDFIEALEKELGK